MQVAHRKVISKVYGRGRGSAFTLQQFADLAEIMTLAAVLAITAIAAGAEATAEAPVDSFKAFIENPPPIANLCCALEDQHSTNYYYLKWQTNGIFLARSPTFAGPVADTTDLSKYSLVIADYDDEYWLKSPNALYVWTNQHNSFETSNYVAVTHKEQRRIHLGELLNFGMQHPGFGHIRWIGDRFESTNSDTKVWVHGALTRDGQGRASKLDLTGGDLTKPKLRPGKWSISYSYNSTEVPSRLPSVCVVQFENSRMTFRYSALKIATIPLTDGDFRIFPYRGKGVDFVQKIQ